MATPNGKGGWDLTDDDVAEVMAASFGEKGTALPDVPRYLVSRSALTAWRENGMLTDQIGMVTYADHVTAMQAAQTISSSVIADFQRQARETALREALTAVGPLTYEEFTGDLEGIEWIDRAEVFTVLERLIDGGDTHGHR